jgi:hypothetical protein
MVARDHASGDVAFALDERRDQPGGLATAAQPQDASAFGLDDVFVVHLRQGIAIHSDLPNC